MEIESRSDLVTFTLPREAAQSLAEAAEAGVALIIALELVRLPASTEHALRELRGQVGRGRGKTVEIALVRGDAALAERAVDIGLRGLEALSQPAPAVAADALVTMRAAIRLVDTPDPANLVIDRPRRRR